MAGSFKGNGNYNISNGHIVNKLTYYLNYLILQTHLMNVSLPNKY
jgi:hypothetical protein